MDKSKKQHNQKNSNSNEIKVEIIPEDYAQYDLSFKIIVIGDAGVGKSCLTLKAIKNYFTEGHNATVGFDFFTYCIKLNGTVIKLQVWDTCGQEIYKSLVFNFFRNSSLALMVYSINSKESFDNINYWLKDIKNQSSPDVKIFLIGNKADLEQEREVPTNDGEKLKEEQKFDLFMETSAKTGFNAEKVFIEAAKILYQDYLSYRERSSRTSSMLSIPLNYSRTGGNRAENVKLPKPKNDNKNNNTKTNDEVKCCK